ncbi:MAG TPA: methyltransferase domain-containing protein, partial [Oscillatoriaceae cyanobacterium]
MPSPKDLIFDLKRRRVRRPADAGVPVSEPVPVLEPEFEPEPELDEEPEPALPLAERLNMPQVLALGMLNRAQEALVIGAGPWAVREWAEALTARTRGVTVVDADKKLLAQARSFCKSAIAAQYDRPDWTSKLGGLRFDVVLVGEALSHLPDPVGFLRQVREILTPDGVVVAIVPNVAHGEKRLELLTGEFPRDFEPVPTCHHYTRTRVRELFAFSGYGITEIQEFEKPLFDDHSELVPELFPAPLLRAIALDEDLATSHFVVKAAPSTPEALLRGL